MIGILNAYHFDKSDRGYQEEYSRLFLEFVQKIYPEKINEITEYKVAQDKFPESVMDCEVWFITGSPKSAYEDIPWINQLKSFIKEIYENKRKTVGICFGHQIVAAALGGEVGKSPKGWGVGIRSFDMLQQKPWMSSFKSLENQKVSMLFSHQDQVEIPPPKAELLAQNSFCPYQMLQIGDFILTMQGHPEFTENFAKERLVSRKEKMSTEVFDRAIMSFEEPNDNKLIIDWIRNFTGP